MYENGTDTNLTFGRFENFISTGINAKLTQDQFNSLVGLRYNVGALGEINRLLPYLESGSYEKSTLRNIINSHYDAIIKSKPDKEKYKVGWYSRTEKTLEIFFDGNYGDMPIDAVNGKVIIQ
ncbi:lysozyme [Clostridium sp. HBUAS56010]|uniref:lysozyme n=1 Tax=Clostridium sp. HBUAS56010 TaxID=2571127 RepID=UPI00117764CE|nr:lysozyme [Clostridium sp. HBUAS56010]